MRYDTTDPPHLELLTGHSAPVSAVAFSPDGRTLATGSYDQTIVLWDLNSGEMLCRLWGQGDSVISVAFSPDGRTLASAGYSVVWLWELPTGRWIGSLPCLTGPIAFSREPGMLLAREHQYLPREVLLRVDVASGRRLPVLSVGTSKGIYVKGTAVSVDESTASVGLGRFSGEVDELQIWDFQTGELLRTRMLPETIECHGLYVDCLALSPDGRWLAVGGNSNLLLCDTRTLRRTQALLVGSNDGPESLAFSPDGRKLAAGTKGGHVRTWSVPEGRVLQRRSAHRSSVTAVAFSAAGEQVASASHDKVVKVWSAETGDCQRTLAGMEFEVQAIAFSPDGGMIASGHEEGTLCLWDVRTGALKHALRGHHKPVVCVCFAPDGKTVASAGSELGDGNPSGEVGLWDPATGASRRALTSVSGGITSLAFAPAHRLLVVGFYGHRHGVQAWDPETGDSRYTLVCGEQWGSTGIALSLDRKTLASTADRGCSIALRRAETGETLRTLGASKEPELLRFLFSSDGETLAAGYVGFYVVLWDIESGVLQRELRTYQDSLSSLAFSPDGRLLAVGGDYGTEVQVFEVGTGEERFMLKGHGGSIRGLAFSPDGRKLASASADGSIRLWDAGRGRLLVTLMLLPSDEGGPWNDWIVFTPEGYCQSSPGAARFIRWRVGLELCPGEVFASAFCQPDTVADLLR